MNSEKLQKREPITKRKSQSHTNSHLNKFIEFLKAHDLPSNPEHWKAHDFNEGLIDRYSSWLIEEGKMVSHYHHERHI